MKNYGLNELREMFLRFFESKGHLRLPSFSLIPQNDASLLLINAGMAPLKPWFTGEQEPPSKRVCTCQKCIRTGDIDNIGKTARHGTYFEMLGNFSFGDYFKRESLAWSWEFLTSPEWVGLDPDRLYPSVYEEDDEAFEIWNKEIGIPAERIFRFGKKDNFWEHGAGPCGPCSEIYYDRGEKYGCGKPDCTVGCECDRYIEVWNNVFSQFNNDGEGNYVELKQKNIDTGMGLERLACVCQDVPSLFDVDTVMRITNKVSEITNAHYGETAAKDVSLRVITDHIRSATFMICDGVLPSNEGRGYVLRRLLRRAARHGKLLGVNEPFLFSVCDTVIAENEGHYPELRERQDYITKIIRVEEENFAKTIDGGLKIFADMLSEHKEKGEKVFSGADAFKLYDTYGFPIDLTIEMAAEQGMNVDEDEFHKQMNEQRQRARKAREALGDLGWAGVEFGKDVPETQFVGYDNTVINDAKVVALVVENELAEEMMPGVEGIVVLDKSPMYAEMGGQIGDHGVISASGMTFVVNDVQKNKGGKYMHYGKLTEGTIKVGDTVTAEIDTKRRLAIARAHSATHMLHSALQAVLGDHVHQAGSLVEPDRLRFDFTHFSAMTTEEIRKVEDIVNDVIFDGLVIDTNEMSIDEAKKMGATALFGEKYGDTVRVVKMGDYSMELCGGTHLNNTAKVGIFKITGEASVAAGVRRIEAVTGREILNSIRNFNDNIAQVADALKTTPNELMRRAGQVMQELRDVTREKDQLMSKLAANQAVELFNFAHVEGNVKVISAKVDIDNMDAMRELADKVRDRGSDVVCVLASVVGESKINFAAVCGKDAVKAGAHAGNILKQVAKIAGGGGGGRPDSATAGGKDPSKLEEALEAVNNIVASMLK